MRVARAGFPVRYTHEQFTSRYAPLARRRHLRQEDDNETGSAAAAGGAAGDSGGGGGDGEAAAKEGDAAKLVSLEGAARYTFEFTEEDKGLGMVHSSAARTRTPCAGLTRLLACLPSERRHAHTPGSKPPPVERQPKTHQ